MKALSLLPVAAIVSSAYLAGHWLALALAALAVLALAAGLLLRSRRPGLGWGLGVAAATLALLALGGLLLPAALGGWVALGAVVALASLLGLLFLTGAWSRHAALALAAVGLVGLGGLALAGVGTWIVEGVEDILSMRLRSPGWLLLLIVVPVIIALSLPRLARDEVVAWTGGAFRFFRLGREAPPWAWLPLLLVLFPFVLLSAVRRIGQDELRPWVALGLRCLGVAFLAFALAEPYISQTSRAMTVLFVVDRSLSIPEEPGLDPAEPGVAIDLRSRRLLKFINDAVQMRGAGHERDMAGLIVFGRRPRLELPPSDAPRFNLTDLPPTDDGQYTDIAAALKLALASFPDGTGKRIVLVSDGNENLGNAEEQARLARSLGVQIDVLPLAAGRRNTEEVLVERVDAPPVIEQGARVPIRVLVRSHNPNVVVGKLTLRQITDKEGSVTLPVDDRGGVGVATENAIPPAQGAKITRVEPKSAAGRAGLEPGEVITQVDETAVKDEVGFVAALATRKPGQRVRLTVVRNPLKIVGEIVPAKLRLGLNPFSFERPLSDEQRSYTYEAEFQPVRVEDAGGKVLQKGLAGDRVQNNRASTHVVARGQGRILLLENKAGEHAELVRRLVDAGRGRFKVVAEPVEVLENYKEAAKLAVFLSNFDCVILANVPADRVSEEHQEVIRSNTHDQGCGLVMIGGPEGFGAGGWQNTPVEKALPVDCDIRSLKVQGKGGLVLIMHACEMANGNFWQKKIAKLAIERLGPGDEVGVIDFGFPGCQWPVPMQEVGPNRASILAKIDAMSPGDMPDFDPALQMAYDALQDRKKDFGAKHIIIISDGDPLQRDKQLLKKIHDRKISIATVGVATHGAPQDKNMEEIATYHKGTNQKRYYKVDDPKKLPAIYIKETRLVSQAFVYRKELKPQLVLRGGPTAKLPDLPSLGGFVRTTPKASNLVEIPILSPRFAEQDFPILAHWHYGLGKAVAFTSDAGRPELWCRNWVSGGDRGDGVFAAFWEQVLGWVLRPVESGKLVMNTEYRDGKVRVTVEARTADGKPDTTLRLRGGLTQPINRAGEPGRRQEVRFVQKNSGQYEAEIKAEEAGSYFITAQATRMRQVQRPGEKAPRLVEEGTDSVRAGVTLPYSPEFSDLESNTPLLDRVMEATGGRAYEDDAELLAEAARSSAVFRPPVERSRSLLPFHYWLLFWAAGLLLLDVAVRRLAFSREETAERARIIWARLRGFPLPPPRDALAVERLRARPPVVVAAGGRAGRRFEGAGGAPASPWVDLAAPAGGAPRAPAVEPPAPPGAPTPEPPVGDTLEALAKRKKQIWDERKKE